jgi:serine protease inhibitor
MTRLMCFSLLFLSQINVSAIQAEEILDRLIVQNNMLTKDFATSVFKENKSNFIITNGSINNSIWVLNSLSEMNDGIKTNIYSQIASDPIKLIQTRQKIDIQRNRFFYNFGVNAIENMNYGLKVIDVENDSVAKKLLNIGSDDLIFAIDGYPTFNLERFNELLRRPIRKINVQWYDYYDRSIKSKNVVLDYSDKKNNSKYEFENAVDITTLIMPKDLKLKPEASQRFEEVLHINFKDLNDIDLPMPEIFDQKSIENFPNLKNLAFNIKDKVKLEQDTVMLSTTNSVKFEWTFPFDKMKTKPKQFTNESGSTTTTLYMSNFIQLDYLKNPNYEIIQLPIKSSNLSALFVLPEKSKQIPDILPEIIDIITKNNLKLDCKRVAFELPRLDFSSSSDLGPFLTRMTSLNNKLSSKEFVSSSNKQISLKTILANSICNVTEQGVNVGEQIVLQPVIPTTKLPEVQLIFDRPFIFILVDRDLNMIYSISCIRTF